MRKHIFLLLLAVGFTAAVQAQNARGIRIGYIDMEYILQNVPDYLEAKNQLELKAQKWKQEAEVKKNDITKLKETLKIERVLLTKELLEEREEEIVFLETELSDFQQKRFGPNGDLYTQKAVLVKPIQDQIFTAVQDLAEVKKYDFIFDKSSDLTMLFGAKRHDISEQVIRSLTRAARRNQMSNKELKEEAKKEYQEDLQDENPTLAERQRKLEEKKANRDKLLADRKAAADQKKADALAKRQQLIDEREAKKAGKPLPTKTTPESGTETPGVTPTKDGEGNTVTAKKEAPDTTVKDSIAASKAAARQEAIDSKAKTMAERKKALEDKKAKALADREAAKQAKLDKTKQPAKTPEEQENKDNNQ